MSAHNWQMTILASVSFGGSVWCALSGQPDYATYFAVLTIFFHRLIVRPR